MLYLIDVDGKLVIDRSLFDPWLIPEKKVTRCGGGWCNGLCATSRGFDRAGRIRAAVIAAEAKVGVPRERRQGLGLFRVGGFLFWHGVVEIQRQMLGNFRQHDPIVIERVPGAGGAGTTPVTGVEEQAWPKFGDVLLEGLNHPAYEKLSIQKTLFHKTFIIGSVLPSIDQSIDQSIDIYRSISRKILHKSINQADNQSTLRSINQSIHRSVNRSNSWEEDSIAPMYQ